MDYPGTFWRGRTSGNNRITLTWGFAPIEVIMATQLFKGRHSQFFQASRVKGALDSGWTTQPTDPEPIKEDDLEEIKELEEKAEALDDELEDLQDELQKLREEAKAKGIKGWHCSGVEKLREKLNEA